MRANMQATRETNRAAVAMGAPAGTIGNPKTGREFALARFTLGLSLRQVALQLGIATDTIRRWETSAGPVEEPRRSKWLRALQSLARERKAELARHGLAEHELAGTSIGEALQAYTPDDTDEDETPPPPSAA